MIQLSAVVGCALLVRKDYVLTELVEELKGS